jgi:Holliday junction DNA helicase RuvA
MIASLNGRIQYKDAESLVVRVGGVGIRVFTPAAVLDAGLPGAEVDLHTYLVVREDSLTLYGFQTREEREFFTLLLGVSGIGPKLALAALSTLNPEAIRRAVFHEQAEVFNRVPGIGLKTAQKILLHLQDRVGASADLAPIASMTDEDTEVLEALVVLGYSVVEAQAALQSIPKDSPADVETRLRLALQYFA